MLDSGPDFLTDLLRTKLEVGVSSSYSEHLQKPFLEPMMTLAFFGAVLTDITHSRVGPWSQPSDYRFT
jgi:hypothetical protein